MSASEAIFPRGNYCPVPPQLYGVMSAQIYFTQTASYALASNLYLSIALSYLN